MRKTALTIALAGALALPSAAAAQGGYMEIHLQLPEILPPLVVIQPGVQVYPEIDHEVFLVNGVYWTRHNGAWYRAENPHGGVWMGVAVPGVPVALVKIPPGKYKKWKPAKARKGAPEAYLQGDGKKAKKQKKH